MRSAVDSDTYRTPDVDSDTDRAPDVDSDTDRAPDVEPMLVTLTLYQRPLESLDDVFGRCTAPCCRVYSIEDSFDEIAAVDDAIRRAVLGLLIALVVVGTITIGCTGRWPL